MKQDWDDHTSVSSHKAYYSLRLWASLYYNNSYIYYIKKQSDHIRIGMQVITLLENDHYTLNVGNCVPKHLHTVFWDNESDNYIY